MRIARRSLLILAGVMLATIGLAGEISTQNIATIREPGKILDCTGVCRTADGEGLHIGVAESDPKLGLLAYQVYSTSAGPEPVKRLFRSEVPRNDSPLNPLRSIAVNRFGELYMAGSFEFSYSTIRRLRDNGEVLSEAPHPEERMARMSSEVIFGLLVDDRDGILAIAHDTVLYGRDLRQKWRLPREHSQAAAGVYDAKRQQFVIARRGGNLNKFGLSTDGKPEVVVIAVAPDGTVKRQAAFAGMTPKLVLSGDEYFLFLDALREGDGRFVLSRLDGELKEISRCALADVPRPVLPSIYPFAFAIRPTGNVVAVGSPSGGLFAREWDAKGNVLMKGDRLWSTPVGVQLWVDVDGDEPRVVSGESDPAGVGATGVVRVDRLIMR